MHPRQVIMRCKVNKLSKLELNNLQLTSLPKSVCELTFLEVLNLNNNYLTKLPKNLNSLRALMQLDIKYNQFATIPRVLAKCTSLLRINARGNPLIKSHKRILKANDVGTIRSFLKLLERNEVDDTTSQPTSPRRGRFGSRLPFAPRTKRGPIRKAFSSSNAERAFVNKNDDFYEKRANTSYGLSMKPAVEVIPKEANKPVHRYNTVQVSITAAGDDSSEEEKAKPRKASTPRVLSTKLNSSRSLDGKPKPASRGKEVTAAAKQDLPLTRKKTAGEPCGFLVYTGDRPDDKDTAHEES